MRFFDLFAGIGGFRLALERLGHKCVGSCEIDKYARETYFKNFKEYPEYDDAKKIKPNILPNFEMLCSGFPCQAFSIAGKRQGFNDTRGTLFFEIIRIARVKKPQILFLENVQGLLFHEKGKTFEIILKALDELGYDVEWQVLNSKYFVPQNRARVFIIGHLRGKCSRQIFPLGYNNSKNEKGVKKNQQINELKQIGELNKNRMGERVYDPKGISTSIRAEGGGWGAKTGLYKTKNRIRRLTPLECERLQGFPDGWTEGISDTQRYKQLGNAVTVNVVEYIGKYF